MSSRDSSERMAFLRREIARIETDGRIHAQEAAPPTSIEALRPDAPPAFILSASRLAAGLHEIVPATAPDMFAALGLALILAAACARARPAAGVVLAIEDLVALEAGAPYGPGLVEAGVDPRNLVIVRTQGPRETLRAMEEALKCRAVAAVLAESALPHRLYTLDASRRLMLAARAGGGAGFLTPIALAGAAPRLSSAATTRVEVIRRSSAAEPVGSARLGLPGAAVAGLRILKARGIFGFDSTCVHEVAFDAFSIDPSALPADRPDPAGDARVALSA